MNFKYNYEKNSQLLETRGIGFEEIIQAISEGNILDIRKHPNELKYTDQKKRKYYLSKTTIQMTKSLSLNPKKFGSIANHKQEI